MSFWAYMLHCRGGFYYVGHTDDLERRVGDHKSGLILGFTADHLPVEHVWSQEFPTRDEARAAEKQVKGWSRAKKLALIRGDWERISALAKSKNGPSTSSGKTGLGMEEVGVERPLPPQTVHPELVEGLSFSLRPHPDAPPRNVRGVEAYTDGKVFHFSVNGQTPLIPPSAPPIRADGLWRTTCFEVFIKRAGHQQYCEFNFSPSGQWAAYAFDSYRQGMRDLPLAAAPIIEPIENGLRVTVDLSTWPGKNLELNISAFIEETDGTKSYWALAHPPGQPDFHHPTCFAATLPAPDKP